MAKGDITESDVLAKIFNNTPLPWDGITHLYVSLHMADPAENGVQSSFEADYTGYARVAVPRNSGGWTVENGLVVNAGVLVFPECTAGTNTITHIAIGTEPTGNGQILYYGELTDPFEITTTRQPQLAAGALAVSED